MELTNNPSDKEIKIFIPKEETRNETIISNVIEYLKYPERYDNIRKMIIQSNCKTTIKNENIE